MKWMDLRSETQGRWTTCVLWIRLMEYLDLPVFSFRPPDAPLPFFKIDAKAKSYTGYGWPENQQRVDSEEIGRWLDEFMEGDARTTADIKNFVRLLDVNLWLEPRLSRRIFARLLSRSLREEDGVTEAVTFLEDMALNTRGAGNYALAVEHLVMRGAGPETLSAFLGVINCALSVGLVSSVQVCGILRSLSMANLADASGLDPAVLVGYYRGIWEAIGLCDVFNHRHLRASVIDTFLESLLKLGSRQGSLYLARDIIEASRGKVLDKSLINGLLETLWKNGPSEDSLYLAKDIILATHGKHSQRRLWVPRFIIQWLVLSPNRDICGDYINDLFRHFSRHVMADYIVCVTESLVFSKDKGALERWSECLFRLRIIPDLALSSAWYDLRPCCDPGSDSALDGYSSHFSKSHQVILRLWVLRNMSMAVADGQYWNWQTPDLTISYLFDFYYYMTRKSDTDHFLTLLMEGIHELGIPPNGLLMAAVDLKTSKTMTKTTRKYLRLLEASEISFADMWRDMHAYNATNRYFFSNYDKLIRQIDITSPSFIEESVNLAISGNSKSVWVLLRLLRSHTPLKIAISMAWRPIPDPSEMALVRWYPEPRSRDCPDPHISLEVIHALAIAFSTSKNLSPRRAFQLVHWLYRFLKQHYAPIKPSLARAMYHAGIVQYRRAGLNVPPGRYDYIMGIVQEFEDPEVVREIMEPPKFG